MTDGAVREAFKAKWPGLLGLLAELTTETARRSFTWPETAGALGLRRGRLAPVMR